MYRRPVEGHKKETLAPILKNGTQSGDRSRPGVYSQMRMTD